MDKSEQRLLSRANTLNKVLHETLNRMSPGKKKPRKAPDESKSTYEQINDLLLEGVDKATEIRGRLFPAPKNPPKTKTKKVKK